MTIGEGNSDSMLKKTQLGKDFQSFFGSLFALLPFSANQLTVIALLLAVAAFYFSFLRLPIHSLALFVLSGALDAIDGAVARAKKQVSARGAYIDGVIDRLAEFLFVLSFLFYPLPSFILPAFLWLIAFLFFGSCMTGFATAYADHRKAASAQRIESQPGLLPRAERLILLFAALAFVPIYPLSASFILACAAVLSFITFWQRFLYFAE